MTDTAPARILVGLDGSAPAEAILPTVRALARRLGDEIVLLHVVHVPIAVPTAGGLTVDEIVAHEAARAGTYLRRIAGDLEEDGLSVRTTVAVGESVPEIVRAAEREHVDFMALATHGRSGVQHWLYGSVADGVLHAARYPLLLLRPGATSAPKEFERIVVALDGSSLAEQALVVARDLARRLAIPLVLLRVVDPLPPAFANDPFAGGAYGQLLASLEADAAAYLEATAARERATGQRVEVSCQTGAPAEIIARHGDAHPHDLLVLGTHGRTGWRAAVLGSVARRVVLLASGPLLVIRATPPES